MEKTPNNIKKVRILSLSRYVEEALKRAEYHKDENGVIIAKVPNASGFFAQEIPHIEGFKIKYVKAETS